MSDLWVITGETILFEPTAAFLALEKAEKPEYTGVVSESYCEPEDLPPNLGPVPLKRQNAVMNENYLTNQDVVRSGLELTR